MHAAPYRPFGDLLRRHRKASGLTQEALADLTGLSPRGIQKLERGGAKPQADTIQRLVKVLTLAPADRAHFESAAMVARGPRVSRADAPHHNLPYQLSSFVGREREAAEVRRLVGTCRLVTLTGPGGVGKTRLALHVAVDAVADFADGVWLVDLAPLVEPDHVLGAVATALGVREAPGHAVRDILLRSLAAKHLLLVLDNCEHLLDASARVAHALPRACGRLHILATSHQPLGVDGERCYSVPPLSVPRSGAPHRMDHLCEYDAVRLFVDRARAVHPQFSLSERNASSVGEICRRLDGLPLAIELAAARVGVLSANQIAERLDDRFRLLVQGKRGAERRQQTLRALIDWSYDLLADADRLLFRRLSVFAGGWTLESAEAVCGGGDLDVLATMASLANQSLVRPEPPGEGGRVDAEPRFSMLESLRAYAKERLVAGDGGADEAAALSGAHAAYYLALTERAEPLLRTAQSAAWGDRLDREHDNLRAAIARWMARGEAGPILRVGGVLHALWQVRGHGAEGRRWLEHALALPAVVPPAVRAKALLGAASLTSLHGDHPRALALLDQAADLARAAGDHQAVAAALHEMGRVAYRRADYERAAAWLHEGLAIARALQDRHGVADAVRYLGAISLDRGAIADARRLLDEALVLHRELGESGQLAMALIHRGDVGLGLEEPGEASRYFQAALELAREEHDRAGLALALDGCAGVAGMRAHHERALRLAGAAAALRETVGQVLPLRRRERHERRMQRAREAMEPSAAAAAWAEGRALTLEQAIAEALDEGPSPASGRRVGDDR